MNKKALYYIWSTVTVVAFIAATLATLAVPLSLGFVVGNFDSPLTYVFIVFSLWMFALVGLYLSRRYAHQIGKATVAQRPVSVKKIEVFVLVLLLGLLAIAVGDALIW